MLRKMSFLAALSWVLIPLTPGYAQDQPSLGDVARQARKDKEKNAAQRKTVITEDDLPSSKALGGLGELGSTKSAGDGDAMAKGLNALDRAETALNKLDPRQVLADVQSLQSSQSGQGKLSPDDPRAQELLRRLQEIVQDAVRTDNAYQSVVVEGWDLAKQAKH